MATFLPYHIPPAPLHDYSPTSPSDREYTQPPHVWQEPRDSRARSRLSQETPNANGPLPMPDRRSTQRATMNLGVFDGPRSPPNAKNTSHVPCKFFRQGTCQAGKACPFSHSTDVQIADMPCKYFARGNCKFGAKCANAHVLSNGRRVNRPNGPMRALELGNRIDPQLYQQSDPALAHSLLAQQASGIHTPFGHQIPSYVENLNGSQSLQAQPFDALSATDAEYKCGSPTDEIRSVISPNARLSVLDAPLPASFDSQGVSYMARHGPVAASVPSKFDLEFSPPSLKLNKVRVPLEPMSNLQNPAQLGQDSRTRGPDLGSSPLGSGDEGFATRFLHSRRTGKPSMMSSSLPRGAMHAPDDWDEGFQFSEGEETDYIPTSLHDQILTPQEKQRRRSRTEQDNRNNRESLSGLLTPADSSSKVGSPSTGSPSRYGTLFARQQQDANAAGSSPSAFGHVGSPLRNSALHPNASPSLRAIRGPGDTSPSFPSFASPPRQSSMSILSQQLSRTRISSKTSESNDINASSYALHPSSARHTSAPHNTLNRAVSSSSIGNPRRADEERGENIFPMEEEEDDPHKRWSGSTVWTHDPSKASPKANPGKALSEKEIWGLRTQQLP